MEELDPNTQQEQPEEPKEPYTPASFEKRVAAWMGIAYMLMFICIISLSMYYPDRSLAGSFPLLLVPVAVAAIIVTVHRQKEGTANGGMPTTVVVVVLCLAVAAVALWLGVPVLISFFGGLDGWTV